MNILMVDGYLREGGNTAKISDRVYQTLTDQGDEVTTIGLRDRNIGDCRDCGGCAGSAGCVVRDDMTALYDQVRSADVIILTSPVYMWGITGLLKNFLDRLYSITDDLEDKKISLIVTAGADPFGGCELAVSQIKRFADYFGMDFVDPLYSAPANVPVSDSQIEKYVLSLKED